MVDLIGAIVSIKDRASLCNRAGGKIHTTYYIHIYGTYNTRAYFQSHIPVNLSLVYTSFFGLVFSASYEVAVGAGVLQIPVTSFLTN